MKYPLINLQSIQERIPKGSVTIGLIDGPVNYDHPDFVGLTVKSVHSNAGKCSVANSPACIHGTFVAGVLCAKEGSPAPGICPEANIVSRPIFCEAKDLSQCPVVTQETLAEAIHDVIESGAHVINLSLGLAPGSYSKNSAGLKNAFDKAKHREVIIVGASGNHGRIGHNPLFDHPWVIPVAACDFQGNIVPSANLGKSIGSRGVMAPGKDVVSCYAGGGYMRMSGTSVAAPFVTGGIARLRALYPNASARLLCDSVLHKAGRHRTIIPQLLDFNKSRNFITANINTN